MIGGHEQLVHELKVPQDIQKIPISDTEEAKVEPSLNESNDDLLQVCICYYSRTLHN